MILKLALRNVRRYSWLKRVSPITTTVSSIHSGWFVAHNNSVCGSVGLLLVEKCSVLFVGGLCLIAEIMIEKQ